MVQDSPARSSTRFARLKVAVVVLGGLCLASLGTHLLAAAAGLPTQVAGGYKRFGTADHSAQGLILGSSLTYSAIDWRQVAQVLGIAIESWPVPGSSPAEWEQLQRRSPQATSTFVGVSVYDLNEESVCEFRANVVPFRQTLADLRDSAPGAAFGRKMLSTYALTWGRALFPTVGLSDRVIYGLRDRAATMVGRAGENEDTGTALRVADDFVPTDKVSDWPEGRLMRRLASMRGSQGRPWFGGPKHLSLVRLLQHASRQGKVVVLVLPVSPLFDDRVISPADTDAFATSLSLVALAVPGVEWVRLDRIAGLRSSVNFSDFVHMNASGRQIATPHFVSSLVAGGWILGDRTAIESRDGQPQM